MISINEKTTVGEIARSFPESTRIFQQYGIDFCCGGNKPLGEVCREKGVPLEGLLASVETAKQPAGASPSYDWNAATATQLINHILEKHHIYLWSELPRLAEMLAKVSQAHAEKHAESLNPLGNLYTGLRQELEEHMWKEENVLFPLIKQMEKAQGGAGMPVGGPIRVMEMEHDSAGNALRQMRQVTSDYQVPPDGCNTYRALFDGLQKLEADLHEHIHLENNILFPKARELGG